MRFQIDPFSPIGISTVVEQPTRKNSGVVASGVTAVLAGTNVTVDNTDPRRPIVSSSGSGGASDATTSSKGIVQLAGDLGGVGSTAAAPIVKNVAKVFNVLDYGAVGDSATDDYTAIMAAITAADTAVAGTVYFPPGHTYLISQPLIYDKTASTLTVPAVSLQGSIGRSGASYDFAANLSEWDAVSSVVIKCKSTFPLGAYVIDWLGPTAQDRSIAGYKISGFVIDCNSRGAGIRNFNPFSASINDIVIDNAPQAPNPSYGGAFVSGSSNSGAFNISAKPTQNSFHNTIERIYVRNAATDNFEFNSGSGSFDLISNCCSNNAGRYGYNCVDKLTLTACIAQANAKTSGAGGADFKVGRYDVTLLGCKAFSGKPQYGNGIKVSGGSSAVAHVIGCTFYGGVNPSQNLSADVVAVVNIQGDLQNIEFVGCHFLTGNSTFTSNFVYGSAGASGRVSFTACQFMTEQGSALTGAPLNLNGRDDIYTFVNCHGLNPRTTKTYPTITNAQQSVQLGVSGGVPTGGTFTLSFGGFTTSPIAYNATAATIQTALAALTSIGSGNVTCASYGSGNVSQVPIIVSFQGTLANAAQALITGDGSSLVNGTTVTIAQILPGGPNVTFDAKDGDFWAVGLNGNISPTVNSGNIKGQELTFEFTQDSTGSRVATWPSNAKNFPVLTTTANAVDTIKAIWDGSNWYKASQGVTRPASVIEGGTGATTVLDARTSLGAVGVIFTGSATNSIGNVTTPTSVFPSSFIGSKTLAANTLIAGRTIRIKIKGNYTTTLTTTNATIAVKLGSTTIATVTVTSIASATNLPFIGEVDITCYTTGVSGTVAIGGGVQFITGLTTMAFGDLSNSAATVTVDTTASKVIDVLANFGTSVATQDIDTITSSIEILN